MIEALKAFGFAAIQPEKLPFDAQVLTFAQADIIVCEFGAAVANAMFCAPGTKIVEIIAEGQQDPWSSHLFAMLGLEHVVLFQRQTEEALASAPRHVKDSTVFLRGRCAEAGRDSASAARRIAARSRSLSWAAMAAFPENRSLDVCPPQRAVDAAVKLNRGRKLCR